jgi:hypothetical protein
MEKITSPQNAKEAEQMPLREANIVKQKRMDRE